MIDKKQIIHFPDRQGIFLSSCRRGKSLLLAGLICLSLTGCIGKNEGGDLTQRGLEALENGDYPTALTDFQQAADGGEEAVPVYRGLGIAYTGLAQYDEAVEAFDFALECADEKMPETVWDIALYRVSALYRAGRYAEVSEACDELRLQKESAEVYFFSGAAKVHQGQPDAAQEDFDLAVSLNPRDYALYLQIYEVYEERNLTATGDMYLQNGLRNQPETTQERYQVGQIYYYLERYDDARSVLDEGYEAQHLPSMELMGQIYLAMNDHAHALSTFQRILEISGESPQADNGIAMCYIASGEYDQALYYIQQGLALEQENGKQELRFNEIVAYEKKLDFATALIKAEAYNELYPGDQKGIRELQFLSTRGR